MADTYMETWLQFLHTLSLPARCPRPGFSVAGWGYGKRRDRGSAEYCSALCSENSQPFKAMHLTSKTAPRGRRSGVFRTVRCQRFHAELKCQQLAIERRENDGEGVLWIECMQCAMIRLGML